jgi:hypothetical protein
MKKKQKIRIRWNSKKKENSYLPSNDRGSYSRYDCWECLDKEWIILLFPVVESLGTSPVKKFRLLNAGCKAGKCCCHNW